ncbi:hypothetical protein [Photobacterium kishitanii]|uniref:Uncharacterized protein n=1 Tax=Photobacterium kishitanii TaxID=318456 RepID=A0A2T3KL45_9GAMM|nr:hypothetical protein [Photobacterium kishitanii]PSV00411.1 hypothetical protein C9J27_04585 [Photobacterium kishitanii]
MSFRDYMPSNLTPDEILVINENDRLSKLCLDISTKINLYSSAHCNTLGLVDEDFRQNAHYRQLLKEYATACATGKAWVKAHKKLILSVSRERMKSLREPKQP